MTLTELARDLALAMMSKSGVREWESPETVSAIGQTALALASQIFLEGVDPEMATKFLVQELDGTPKQMVFADHATDFNPTAANDLRKTTDGTQETDVQFTFEGVTNNSYRQSTKCDLGENRAPAYKVRAALEFAATPTAGNVCRLFWAPSLSATAGTGNPGGASGADSAYTGYSSNADASAKQLDFIGNFTCTAQATATIQIAEVGVFVPSSRYGSLVVQNSSGATMHSDSVEMNIVFDPILPEAQ